MQVRNDPLDKRYTYLVARKDRPALLAQRFEIDRDTMDALILLHKNLKELRKCQNAQMP